MNWLMDSQFVPLKLVLAFILCVLYCQVNCKSFETCTPKKDQVPLTNFIQAQCYVKL